MSSFDESSQIANARGFAFSHHPFVHSEVVDCVEAAQARGIPLRIELKSLVLSTSTGIAVANVLGNTRLNLRAVKRLLGVRQACLASIVELQELGHFPGTICPLLPKFWVFPQLVSKDVLREEIVYTNDGTLRGYIAFSPCLLLEAPVSFVGNLSRLST